MVTVVLMNIILDGARDEDAEEMVDTALIVVKPLKDTMLWQMMYMA